jgi:hypothetical protein
MFSRVIVVTMIGKSVPGRVGQSDHVVLQLAGRIIVDAGHEADLIR